MNKIFFLILFLIINFNANAEENMMILKLKDGDVEIQLFPDVAPKHVERIQKLANDGLYDNVVFHRVIDGFMAQTGDVKFGNSSSKDFLLAAYFFTSFLRLTSLAIMDFFAIEKNL